MSLKLNPARQLIQDGDFDVAKQMLEKESGDRHALYLLSLLYRYDDDYDKEFEAVKRSIDIDGSNTYMRERLAWHNLPLFDRVVPRKSLDLSRDPEATPSQEMLDQLCFVTTSGSDEPFRQLTIELIESLEATRLYKNTPIYIFDAGLTEEDKYFLMNRFKNIKEIKDPGWDVDAGDVKNGYKATTARVFMNKHFPGHRYYLWIDTDCWVQNEIAIDELINFAQKQGIGICPDVIPSRMYYASMPSPAQYKETSFLQGQPATDALFCIDAATGKFDEFQRIFLELYKFGGFSHFIGQFVINVILRKDGQELKQADLQRVLFNVSVNCLTGCPLLDESNHILNLQKEFVGVAHLTWDAKYATPYCRPFIKSTSKRISLEYSNEIETLFWQNQLHVNEDIKYSSLCYRTWPWADKPQLHQLLMNGGLRPLHQSP